MKRGLLIIGLLAILTGCGSLAMLVREAGDAAVGQALQAADAEDQKVTAVCVGLNIGSCRTTQASTTRPAGDAGDGNPWPVILLFTALLCPVVLGVAVVIGGDGNEVMR